LFSLRALCACVVRQYLLLLQELIKRSASATSVPEVALSDMISAKEKIGNIANAINASLHQKENQIKVGAIQARFERDSRFQPLVTPTRYLVREGPLKKRYGKGTRHLASSTVYHFLLFNDVLVYADFSKNVIGKGVTYKLKHMLPIGDMTVQPMSSQCTRSSSAHADAGRRHATLRRSGAMCSERSLHRATLTPGCSLSALSFLVQAPRARTRTCS